MPRVQLFSVFGAASLMLAGCSGGGAGGGTAASGFASVSGGEIAVNLESEFNGSIDSAPNIGRVAYMTGIDDRGGQIESYSGIIGTPSVGAEVVRGTATYDARYEYIVVDRVNKSGGFIQGNRGGEIGVIRLTADLSDKTLTGNTSELRVDGRIDGKDISGTVVAKYAYGLTAFSPDTITGRVKGPLDGRIGARGVIGTFHGNDANTTMAGGFVGEAN